MKLKLKILYKNKLRQEYFKRKNVKWNNKQS